MPVPKSSPGTKKQPKAAPARRPRPAKAASTALPKRPSPKARPATKAKATPEAQAPAPAPREAALIPKLALVIDDEPANRDFLERLIQQAQYQTRGAATGAEAQTILDSLPGSPCLIIIDSELPDTKGLQLLKKFRQAHPQSKLIMATMLDERTLIDDAFASGCDVFMVKPHGFMELFKRIQQLDQNPGALDQLIFDSLGVRARK